MPGVINLEKNRTWSTLDDAALLTRLKQGIQKPGSSILGCQYDLIGCLSNVMGFVSDFYYSIKPFILKEVRRVRHEEDLY